MSGNGPYEQNTDDEAEEDSSYPEIPIFGIDPELYWSIAELERYVAEKRRLLKGLGPNSISTPSTQYNLRKALDMIAMKREPEGQ